MNPMDRGMSVAFSLKEQLAVRNQELVSAAQAGSPTAFAELQALYAQRLYRRIALITKNREDAEDALQDTFMRAYLAIRDFEGRSSIYSWLTRIAINSALMVIRRRRNRAEIFFDLPYGEHDDAPTLDLKDSAPDPEQVYAEQQQRMHLLGAIQRLDPKLREPVEIHMKRECSMHEIARTLDISVAAVKTRLHRARRQLATSKSFKYPGAKGHLPQIARARSAALTSRMEGGHV